jgi:hypothetical protein
MALTVLRLPRSFAGDKAAPLEDFFDSMAHALARGDPAKKEAIQHFCDRVQANLCARAVFDIGGLQRMSRNNMLQLLVSIEKDTEHWVDSIEDVLNFSFPTPVITDQQVGRDPAQPPASAALVPKSVGSRPGGLRTSKYLAEKGKLGLGARLLSNGELDGVVFSLTMFPKLETSNPAVETITEPDVSHILDTVFEMTFTKYGEVHVDKTYRVHCGQKLRLLFPNLPTRGGKLGDDRMFDEMLKWRFGNQRKSAVEGKIPYKAGMVFDRINLCDAAIQLVEEMNFPVTVVNEGKLETKFNMKQQMDDVDEMQYDPDGWAGAAGVAGATPPQIFGSASSFNTQQLPKPLPERRMTKGPLAPLTATAANAAVHTRSTDDNNDINDDGATLKPATKKRAPGTESSEEPAPKAKRAAKAPARTEPVPLFKASGLPLEALPFKKEQKGDEVVVCVPYMDEEGKLVPEYWYGVVSLACANASWIKFYDIEDIFKETKRHISEEKHKLHQKDYYDSWMLVKKVLVEEAAGAEEAAPTAI